MLGFIFFRSDQGHRFPVVIPVDLQLFFAFALDWLTLLDPRCITLPGIIYRRASGWLLEVSTLGLAY